MTERSKKVWRVVGISVGVLLILGTGAFLYYRSTKSDDEEKEENPYLPTQPKATTTPKTGTAGLYTKSEIENMQSWLLSTGIRNFNAVIIDAINSTGGIDGIIGNGFYTALAEARKEGYVENLEELYEITNT